MRIATQGLDCEIKLGPPDVEDWMRAEVRVRVPSFHGAFDFSFQVADWRQLIADLQHLSDAAGQRVTKEWRNLEGNLWLQLALDPRGAIAGAYELTPRADGAPRLRGPFEADQSHLASWISEAIDDLPA